MTNSSRLDDGAVLRAFYGAPSLCTGCKAPNCSALWPEQRKCCPDCSHHWDEVARRLAGKLQLCAFATKVLAGKPQLYRAELRTVMEYVRACDQAWAERNFAALVALLDTTRDSFGERVLSAPWGAR